MRGNAQNLNTAVLAQLLTEAFMDQRDLRRFCRDSPEFRPVLELVSVSTGLRDHVDVLIRFCETRLLFDELLAAVERDNPRQYVRFEPSLYDPVPVDREEPVRPPPPDVSETLDQQPMTTTEVPSETTRRSLPGRRRGWWFKNRWRLLLTAIGVMVASFLPIAILDNLDIVRGWGGLLFALISFFVFGLPTMYLLWRKLPNFLDR